ncbi:hypothetical protein DDZ16_01325 [Marinilabilia rubra]|uniref:Uncharacterized protein n=1 Tax=Marinilabilia rubra TaxID=2162893 RepID=A0A2U2BDK6_9BACT|nr:hypothetical protein DDZ16_01325 [Marinilabilia rubra]
MNFCFLQGKRGNGWKFLPDMADKKHYICKVFKFGTAIARLKKLKNQCRSVKMAFCAGGLQLLDSLIRK